MVLDDSGSMGASESSTDIFFLPFQYSGNAVSNLSLKSTAERVTPAKTDERWGPRKQSVSVAIRQHSAIVASCGSLTLTAM